MTEIEKCVECGHDHEKGGAHGAGHAVAHGAGEAKCTKCEHEHPSEGKCSKCQCG